MSTPLNPRFTLETFVVGAANRLAVAAARSVAESPGSAYNPLFIYSASGLGKTHLLMAMGHAARQIAPGLTVNYITVDEFVEAFHAAVAKGAKDALRKQFETFDMLLVDDVQFLAERREMQAELLRLTEALLAAGHQIVLTSDRPPTEIAALDERLIARFAGGLVVDMGPPDYETRVAILRRKAEERNAEFAAGVLEAAASLDLGNVRELMGALNRLIAYQAVSDVPLAAATAREVLGAGPGDVALAASAPTEAGATAPADPPAGPGPDEFGTFLSEVEQTVGRAVEAWRARVAEAVLHWEGEGYRTTRLEALLEAASPETVEQTIATYVADVERLRALEREVSALDAATAGSPVLRDPARLAEAEEFVARVRAGGAPPPGPLADYSLDRFVTGPSNEVAISAAREVCAAPGQRYNPLVLVGPPGHGKTHLLHAIGGELARRAGAVVACLSAADFTNELIEAIDTGRVERWRVRYRRATALLLDDIDALAGKDRTQEELFTLFNLLLGGDRQLVFTAVAHPRRLDGLAARIVSRLAGGLVVELGAPDRAMRVAALERALSDRSTAPDPALVAYLADRPAESLVPLLESLDRVATAAAAQDRALTAEFARAVLEGPAPTDRRTQGMRTSGIVVSSASGVRSREKMVWDWPDVGERLIEELW